MSKMADLSLDDYMQKKNFRVQIQNDTWNKGSNVGLMTPKNQNNPGGLNRIQFNKPRGPSVTVTGLGNVKTFDARQKIGPKVQFDARERLQKKKPVDARLKITGFRGQGGGPNSGNQGSGVRQKITGPGNVSQMVRQKITGPGSGTTGVRQRITGLESGVRQRITGLESGVWQRITGLESGVRQRITVPGQTEGPTLTVKLGSLGNDARKKIIALQSDKGMFDARTRIGTKPANPQQPGTVTGLGNGTQDTGSTIIRNLNTRQTSDNGKGTKIQLTNSGLQITRAIPSATVSFEGSMLTVTKRTQEYQQQEEEMVQTDVGDQYLQDNEFDEYEEENQLDLESAEEIKPKLLQIKKTIKTTPIPVKNPPKFVTSTLKRKAPQPTPVQSSGPLKLLKPSGSAHIPVIVPQKKAKITTPVSKPVLKQAKVFQVKDPVVEQAEEEEDGGQDFLSPLQGYRVYVTNLHLVVNQDDIIIDFESTVLCIQDSISIPQILNHNKLPNSKSKTELFGAIGALRKAKLIKPGTAEVVYIKKEDAIKAVQKYHNRELDGLPMQVKLLTSTTAAIKVPTQAPPEDDNSEVAREGPLKLLKQPSSAATILCMQPDAESAVELPLVHKALFKVGTQGTSKPVTFTVKI